MVLQNVRLMPWRHYARQVLDLRHKGFVPRSLFVKGAALLFSYASIKACASTLRLNILSNIKRTGL